MPDLNFTDFYPLWRLSDVVATGTFNSHWNGSYDRITLKSKAYWYPQHGGCGQKIPSFKLKPTPALPGPIASIETLGNGVVYVLCSTIYPILYVGITDKGLRKGIFGGGVLRITCANSMLLTRVALVTLRVGQRTQLPDIVTAFVSMRNQPNRQRRTAAP